MPLRRRFLPRGARQNRLQSKEASYSLASMKFGTVLPSRNAVFSPMLGLTSVFGMVTGVTPAPWAPITDIITHNIGNRWP